MEADPTKPILGFWFSDTAKRAELIRELRRRLAEVTGIPFIEDRPASTLGFWFLDAWNQTATIADLRRQIAQVTA